MLQIIIKYGYLYIDTRHMPAWCSSVTLAVQEGVPVVNSHQGPSWTDVSNGIYMSCQFIFPSWPDFLWVPISTELLPHANGFDVAVSN